jgi:3-oxoadipate enol-lactonase
MPRVRVRDINIYYEIRGAGDTLIYISGTGGDLRHSPTVFDRPIASHFRILAYDQRGLGQTEKPDKPYTMGDYAEDAHGLLEALGWESTHVMGVSFGGMVAQEFAIRHPDRVKRLVLACTSSGGAGGSSYPLHELWDLPARDRIARQLERSDTRRDKQWQAMNPQQWQSMINNRLAAQEASAGELGRAMGQRRQLEARRNHDAYTRLPQLTMPVYICGGYYDGLATPDNLRALKRQIPNATLTFFQGGHSFLSDDPDAWTSVIAFLKAR